MMVMAGSTAAGNRHDVGAAVESSHLETHEAERKLTVTPLPTMPHLPILPTQFYKLGVNYSNICAYESHSHSDSHIPYLFLLACSQHIRMKNAFSPTSKVPLVFQSEQSHSTLLTVILL